MDACIQQAVNLFEAAERARHAREIFVKDLQRLSTGTQNSQLLTLLGNATLGTSSTLVDRALEVASSHHEAQIRKNGDFYITHPIAVAQCIARWGGSCNDVLVGLLHDVGEDSPAGLEVTLSAIGREFGAEVAWGVMALTKSASIDKDAANFEAYQRVSASLGFGQVGVAAVKLADRLHNSCTAWFLSKEKIARLDRENAKWYAPLAHRVGAYALADIFANSVAQLREETFLEYETRAWIPAALEACTETMT